MKTSTSRALAGLLFLGAVAAGCGARSDLQGETASGGAPSSTSSASTSSSAASSASSAASSTGGPPCLSDAECDDGVPCTVDTCEPTGCVHAPDDAACDDGKLCTADTCVPGVGCQHVHSDAMCDDGIGCTLDACDAASDTCQHTACDSMCEDGVFCTGVKRCDTTHGCTAGPPACQLGFPCSTNTCIEASKTCSDPPPGSCVPTIRLLVATDDGTLLSVSPYGGAPVTVAATKGTIHFDVAVLGGRWFVIDPSTQQIVELFPMTNQAKKAFPGPDANSLGAGPDGKLYAASNIVYRIDPDTGAVTVLGSLPPGYSSSGDIAFLDGKMYISTDGPCGGALVLFDPVTASSTVLGGDGLGCVYGLAVSGGTMFILNCDGKIGTWDPATGVAHVLSTPGIKVYGADVLP